MTTLRQLEYFVTLAEEKHFSKAADKCHISQPTLSIQIQNLEEGLDVQLIERRKKDFVLTNIGEKVLQQAKLTLQAVDGIKELCDAEKEPLTGKLVMGVIPTIAPYFLPQVLPHIQKDFPNLELYLREEKTPDLLKMLEDGEVDLCFLALPAGDGKVATHIDIFREKFLGALPKQHKLSTANKLDLDLLEEGELLLLEEGHCLRDHAMDACKLLPQTDKGSSFKATSLETLKQMVAVGRGITLLPSTAIEKNASYDVKELTVQGASRRIGLMWRKSSMRGAEFRMLAQSIAKASDALSVESILK